MKKYLALFALACACMFAPAASAQSCINSSGKITLSSSGITDSATAGITGTISFTPTNNSGTAIDAQIDATSLHGQIIPRPVVVAITSGAFTATLADTACTVPANLCYSVSVLDNSDGSVYPLAGFSCYQPTAPSSSSTAVNFDLATPNEAALLQNLTLSGESITPASVTTAGNVTASRLISTVGTGTAPLTVASTTVVPNLNASLLSGIASSTFAQLGLANTFTGITTFSADQLLGANYINVGSGRVFLGYDSLAGISIQGAEGTASNTEYYNALRNYSHHYGSSSQQFDSGCSSGAGGVTGIICGLDTSAAGTDTASDLQLGLNAPYTVIGNGGAYNFIFDSNSDFTCAASATCNIGIVPPVGLPHTAGAGTSGITVGSNPNVYAQTLYGTSLYVASSGTTVLNSPLNLGSTVIDYDNLTTAGLGMASIMGSYSWIGKTAAVASTNLTCGGTTCGQGMYRVTFYADNASSCASGATITYKLTWNDGNAQTSTLAIVTGAANAAQAVFVIGSAGTSSPVFSNTVTGITGSCSYTGDLVLELLESATGNTSL